MWQAYKKRFIPSQLFIAGVCLVFMFALKWPAGNVLFVFVVMQLFSFLGVLMGERMKRQLERNAGK
jgi:hypothetical protein